jgi:hypothetical protein
MSVAIVSTLLGAPGDGDDDDDGDAEAALLLKEVESGWSTTVTVPFYCITIKGI